MAAKLADELLQMILKSSLTIAREKFISSSLTAFGQNDAVSSASALLVCKRWLRVATPLLYETLIIRSTGQCQALADTFRDHPAFAQLVKKVRLEGAYASLGEVLTRCSKMETLVILLHIYSNANVKGLCLAFPRINPTEVILRDQYRVDNAKIRAVFIALCDAIPAWNSFATFDFPYNNWSSEGTTAIEPGVLRQDRLINALTKSASLRFIFCKIPGPPDGSWWRLALIPSITLTFRYCSKSPAALEFQKGIVEILYREFQPPRPSIEFMDVLGTRSSSPGSVKQKPMTLESSSRLLTSIPESVWTRIFAFATIPTHPAPSDIYVSSWDMSVPGLNATRRNLSLACKAFERLVRLIFLKFPIICSAKALKLFLSKVLQDPDLLGRQVQMLSIAMPDYLVPKLDEDLCILIPHLTRLQHFICWFTPALISEKAFALLAETTGPTLMTLAGVRIRPADHSPLPLTVLTSFTRLSLLDIRCCSLGTADKVNLPRNALSSLSKLYFDDDTNLSGAISLLSLPQLVSVMFSHACTPVQVENFLQACGSRLEELCFEGCAYLVDIFKYTPNLRCLRWNPLRAHVKLSLTLAATLNVSAAHAKLQKFELDAMPGPVSVKRETANINDFFNSLDLTNFPSLKEIRFRHYTWPTHERGMLKSALPRMAVHAKQEHGIDVTDHSGKPWRPRVKRS